MKLMRGLNACVLGLATGLLLMIGAVTLAEESDPGKSKPALPLVPILATALDCPEFALDYVNNTSKPVDITDLLQGSSAVIDGKLYARTVVAFVGNPMLDPGGKHSFTVSLAEYLPQGDKKGYSKVLKRWRWSFPLESGKHTITVKLGGKEYGPTTFVWKGDVPLLYE